MYQPIVENPLTLIRKVIALRGKPQITVELPQNELRFKESLPYAEDL